MWQSFFDLEALPLEVFQLVLPHLDVAALLSLQFVSESINARTKDLHGKALIDPKAIRGKAAYIEAVCALEHVGFFGKKLDLLTCRNCGQRKAIGLIGFHDQGFHKDIQGRYCIQCKTYRCSKFRPTVHGVPVGCCYYCRRYQHFA